MKTYDELSLKDKKIFDASNYLTDSLAEFKKFCAAKHISFEDAIKFNGTYWIVSQVDIYTAHNINFFINENKDLLQYIKNLETQITSSNILIRAYNYDEQFYNEHITYCMIQSNFKYRLLDIL